MTTLYDINKLLIELGKLQIDSNREKIDQESYRKIEEILINPFLADYQKRYLVNELLAEKSIAQQMENRQKALLFVAEFLNELSKRKQGK